MYGDIGITDTRTQEHKNSKNRKTARTEEQQEHQEQEACKLFDLRTD